MERYIPFNFKRFRESTSHLEISQHVMDYLKHKDASKLLQIIADDLLKTGNKRAADKILNIIHEI